MNYKDIQLQAENDVLCSLGMDIPKRYASKSACLSEEFAGVYSSACERVRQSIKTGSEASQTALQDVLKRIENVNISGVEGMTQQGQHVVDIIRKAMGQNSESFKRYGTMLQSLMGRFQDSQVSRNLVGGAIAAPFVAGGLTSYFLNKAQNDRQQRLINYLTQRDAYRDMQNKQTAILQSKAGNTEKQAFWGGKKKVRIEELEHQALQYAKKMEELEARLGLAEKHMGKGKHVLIGMGLGAFGPSLVSASLEGLKSSFYPRDTGQ